MECDAGVCSNSFLVELGSASEGLGEVSGGVWQRLGRGLEEAGKRWEWGLASSPAHIRSWNMQPPREQLNTALPKELCPCQRSQPVRRAKHSAMSAGCCYVSSLAGQAQPLAHLCIIYNMGYGGRGQGAVHCGGSEMASSLLSLDACCTALRTSSGLTGRQPNLPQRRPCQEGSRTRLQALTGLLASEQSGHSCKT